MQFSRSIGSSLSIFFSHFLSFPLAHAYRYSFNAWESSVELAHAVLLREQSTEKSREASERAPQQPHKHNVLRVKNTRTHTQFHKRTLSHNTLSWLSSVAGASHLLIAYASLSHTPLVRIKLDSCARSLSLLRAYYHIPPLVHRLLTD